MLRREYYYHYNDKIVSSSGGGVIGYGFTPGAHSHAYEAPLEPT